MKIIPHAVVVSEHLCQVRMDSRAFSRAALVLWLLVHKVVKSQLEVCECSFDFLWVPLAVVLLSLPFRNSQATSHSMTTPRHHAALII